MLSYLHSSHPASLLKKTILWCGYWRTQSMFNNDIISCNRSSYKLDVYISMKKYLRHLSRRENYLYRIFVSLFISSLSHLLLFTPLCVILLLIIRLRFPLWSPNVENFWLKNRSLITWWFSYSNNMQPPWQNSSSHSSHVCDYNNMKLLLHEKRNDFLYYHNWNCF